MTRSSAPVDGEEHVETKFSTTEAALERSLRELEVRNRIAAVFLSTTGEDTFTGLLTILLDVFQSPFGVFGFVDEDGALVVPAMARDLRNPRELAGGRVVFPRETWGDSIWLAAVRTKEIQHSNAPSPLTPEEHRTVERNLAAPIVLGDRTIGLLQVADKETDYDADDLATARLFADAIGPILGTRLDRDREEQRHERVEAELRTRAAELERHRNHLQALVGEQAREQACLHNTLKLLTASTGSVTELLQEVTQGIPAGFRRAEEICARVRLDGHPFTTEPFREAGGGLTADLEVAGSLRGSVEVFSLRVRSSAEGSPFLGEEHQLIGAIANLIGQELARREGIDSLRESEARGRQVFDLSPEAIFVVGPEGTFLDLNEAAVRRYGYTREELLGMGPKDLATPDRKAELERELRGSMTRASQFEWSHRTKNGQEIPVEIHTAPLLMDNRACILASVRDISDRKAQEAERQQLHLQVVQAQRMESVGTLASGVAHEINNPLNIVMNFAELIQDEEGTPDVVRGHAATIVDESLRMAGIVRNLLAFSRNAKETHSPADVSTLVESTLGLIRASLRKDQVELIVEIADGLQKVRCRTQQIQQVLLNLLTNARDALNLRYPGADPDKIIRVTAHPFSRDAVPWIRLSVEDHGGGIAADIAPHVFEPFFTTKPRNEGTGLGLSISYGLIKDHRGDLTFTSTPGADTTFHIDLKVQNGWAGPSAAPDDTEEA